MDTSTYKIDDIEDLICNINGAIILSKTYLCTLSDHKIDGATLIEYEIKDKIKEWKKTLEILKKRLTCKHPVIIYENFSCGHNGYKEEHWCEDCLLKFEFISKQKLKNN
jgi:hypothetical protein